MATHIIKMPDIGEGIAEVELAEWHVKPGDTVQEDQLLADVMTDKATVQVPSPVTGTVVSLGGNVGDLMAVGSELIRLEVEGQGNTVEESAVARPAAPTPARDPSAPAKEPQADGLLPKAAAAPHAPAPDERQLPEDTVSPGGVSLASKHGAQAGGTQEARLAGAGRSSAEAHAGMPPRPAGQKPLASPAVRRRAWDQGIELRYVPGTGDAGRITHEDLAHFAQRTRATGAPVSPLRHGPRTHEETLPVVGLRRKIAQKMQESKRRIPHFSYVEEIDVTELESLRGRMNERWGQERGKLTLLPLLVRAIVTALPDFPQINARFDDDAGTVTRYGAVHMGVATQTDAGLMVPVLRHAESLDPWACATEIARLADAARHGKASREELTGSTITLSSLGPLGGIVSTPVINHPEVAIVGVNRIVERPMIVGGAVVARKMMNLSSSFDHRVVDGMDAARFIQAIRALLECPAMLFVE